MTYKEYTRNRQKEFDALPIFFAFSNEQFEQGMNERGLTVKDTDKIYRLGHSGGFYLKADADKIRKWLDNDTLDDLMKDEGFAVDAFLYEMNNHEYQINWQGDWDVVNCFFKVEYGDEKDYADYLNEAGHSELITAFAKAKHEHFRLAEENDWF